MSTIHRARAGIHVRVELDLFAGSEGYKARVGTGVRALDHLLITLARHAGFGLILDAQGGTHRQRAEEIATALGLALRAEIPESCQRYGDAVIVVGEAMVQVALDLHGLTYYRGPLPGARYDHLLRALAESARITLHLLVLRGMNRRGVAEAGVRALGLALRRALAPGEALFRVNDGGQLSQPRSSSGIGRGVGGEGDNLL
jgi:imidazoleglycerol-phosphate dehydratase